ncbi:sigma factor [Streptomyces sp. NBC_01476]|uniref:sigma factor n=1 Tax=Streptomyces sp. NBC_01476 TaxID=2903881 RepID=UPI003FCE5C21
MRGKSQIKTVDGGDRQAVEGLVQETMLRAWRNLHVLHDDPKAAHPWPLTVARERTGWLLPP